MQFGNSVPVSVVEKVANKMLEHINLIDDNKQVAKVKDTKNYLVGIKFPSSRQVSINF